MGTSRQSNGGPPRRGGRSAFLTWTGPTRDPVPLGSTRVGLPIVHYDSDAFVGLFDADAAAVRRHLPAPSLHPVLRSARRAVIAVAAFRHHHLAAREDAERYALLSPYGALTVCLLCTQDRPGPPLLPLLGRRGLGAYVLALPVTAASPRDIGREVFGLPAFVASLCFEERERHRTVRLEEGGGHVLSLTVRSGGLGTTDRRPVTVYGVLDGRLARTPTPLRGAVWTRLGRGSARLVLGEHPVADLLRTLRVSPDGLASRDYGRLQAILPPPTTTEEPARHASDHPGTDLPHGRYTVAWDDRVEVDVHAELGIAGAPHRTARDVKPRTPSGYVPEPLA